MDRREMTLSPHRDGHPPAPLPPTHVRDPAPLVAVGVPAALPGGAPLPAPSCLNCGTILTGPFCAQCGQHIADYHRSVWRLVADFLDNLFCWDNKLLRTLIPLFRRPGLLTYDFMAGRRVRYVHPLKLFLFTSAACLTLMHFDDGSTAKNRAAARHRRRARSAQSTPDAAGKSTPAADPDDKADSDDKDDSANKTDAGADHTIKPLDARPAPLPPEAAAILARLAGDATPAPGPGASASPDPGSKDADELAASVQQKLKENLGENGARQATALGRQIGRSVEKSIAAKGVEGISRDVAANFRQRLSWVALAILPVFALMLRTLYWRKDTFYFLHLIFSLHYNTFLLIFWTVYSRVSTWLEDTFLHDVAALLLLVPPVYLFLALRRVYGGGVRRTWTKTILLGGMHLLVIVIGLGVVGALAVFSAMW